MTKYPYGTAQAFCDHFARWMYEHGYKGKVWCNGQYLETEPLPPPELIAEYNRQAPKEL
jgi:hypothetical protein